MWKSDQSNIKWVEHAGKSLGNCPKGGETIKNREDNSFFIEKENTADNIDAYLTSRHVKETHVSNQK